MLNGEKYREVCPENTLLNSMQLRGCIIPPQHKKPLLKRESALGVTDDVRIFLPIEVRTTRGSWLVGLAGQGSCPCFIHAQSCVVVVLLGMQRAWAG